MSVSLTLGAVQTRIKTVTRRHVHTWRNLKPGDQLTLIEKGMGLPKGAKQVVVARVEVVSVRVETIDQVTVQEVAREGLGNMSPTDFIAFWLKSHKYDSDQLQAPCRRIEWRYLDEIAIS